MNIEHRDIPPHIIKLVHTHAEDAGRAQKELNYFVEYGCLSQTFVDQFYSKISVGAENGGSVQVH